MDNYFNVFENKVVKLPMNSQKCHMQNKQCNYKIYALMTLYSNMTPKEISYEKGEEELYRYLYENKINANMEDFESLSKTKRDTIFRNIRKLTKLSTRLVNPVNTPNGICYYINYTDDKGRKYVVIEEDMLRYLIDTSNSNTIKIYILLKYLCKDDYKKVTLEYICEQIGLSSKCKNNLSSVSNMINSLRKNGFIMQKKDSSTEYCEDSGKRVYKTYNLYKICSHDEWVEIKNKR